MRVGTAVPREKPPSRLRTAPAGVTPSAHSGRCRGPPRGSATRLGCQRQQNALETCARSMWRLRVKSKRGVMERELSRRPRHRSTSSREVSHCGNPELPRSGERSSGPCHVKAGTLNRRGEVGRGSAAQRASQRPAPSPNRRQRLPLFSSAAENPMPTGHLTRRQVTQCSSNTSFPIGWIGFAPCPHRPPPTPPRPGRDHRRHPSRAAPTARRPTPAARRPPAPPRLRRLPNSHAVSVCGPVRGRSRPLRLVRSIHPSAMGPGGFRGSRHGRPPVDRADQGGPLHRAQGAYPGLRLLRGHRRTRRGQLTARNDRGRLLLCGELGIQRSRRRPWRVRRESCPGTHERQEAVTHRPE
jgi:hypothetical protein